MLFNSYDFLLIFLPLSLIIFYGLPKKFRIIFLILCSMIFYGVSGIVALTALIIGSLSSYFLVLVAKKKKITFFFILSVIIPILILINYKYLLFVAVDIPILLELQPLKVENLPLFMRILLPAGMSFYTLQIISFSVDTFNNKISNTTLKNYFFYISFFPQLISGPILRYSQMENQIKKIENNERKIDLTLGMKLLSFGLAIKIFGSDITKILADSVSELIVKDSGISIIDFFSYIFFYSNRIYFDFASYSIMAIGIAALFGIKLPRNFDDPYLSKSPKDFWRKWHITLSYWLRDYVYIRIGGNKLYTRNIIITLIISGVWHGAGFDFIIWGIYHAALIIGYKASTSFWEKQITFLRIATTYILISLSWPLFDLGLLNYINLISLIDLSFSSIFSLRHFMYLIFLFFIIFIVRIDQFCLTEKKDIFVSNPIVHALIIVSCFVFLNLSNTFIYFRF